MAPACDVAVVVDVLSFTTTLSVALDRGVEILPYRWADQGAADFAARHDAVLAVGRSLARPGQVSLSPLTVRAAGPQLQRLVLPSPNGATIAHRLSDAGVHVVAASLRNAEAVASWLSQQHGWQKAKVLVIAAGEHWPGGQLRPAVEDLWGAGAVIAGLRRRGWVGLSVEAVMAADAYDGVRADLNHALQGCANGRELMAMGLAGDVAVAGEVDVSQVVPGLVNGTFRDARAV
ncbi:2-phosphosulfolactate phosphatase [Kineococcus rubinsiae]|uniref:2-phosphosulfolactate phosphatase n=1 Tax=Kineococcus rubinsiae TaxID=2609562 RepID=UPI001431C561|nr:2-phosphosulfolactate phosphatase [Kineococcus rubinsiae]